VIEPFYSKVADFSIQYEIFSLPEGIKIKRYEPRFFFVDEQLQYLCAWLGAIPANHELFPSWQLIEKNKAMISAAHEEILQRLIAEGYVGPVGIDALVTKTEVIPVIEVNVRYTMGRVAHALETALRKHGITTSAMMKFHSKQELKREGLTSFPELAARLDPSSFFAVTPLDSAVSTWVAVHFTV
jgi:hypothetical protein